MQSINSSRLEAEPAKQASESTAARLMADLPIAIFWKSSGVISSFL